MIEQYYCSDYNHIVFNLNLINKPYRHIGIHAAPFSKFLINNGEITIGSTGIYEIDMNDLNGYINSIIIPENHSNINQFIPILIDLIE
jgi:hypothetical protein